MKQHFLFDSMILCKMQLRIYTRTGKRGDNVCELFRCCVCYLRAVEALNIPHASIRDEVNHVHHNAKIVEEAQVPKVRAAETNLVEEGKVRLVKSRLGSLYSKFIDIDSIFLRLCFRSPLSHSRERSEQLLLRAGI